MSTSGWLQTNDVQAPARTARPLLRRLAAIAFLDMVGYSRLTGQSEDRTLHAWSDLQSDVIAPRTRSWRGRIVNRSGDGLFLEFPSALDAFRWAVDVQGAIASHSFTHGPLQVRVALHLGDVIDDRHGEVQGDGVNTAARLQAHAEPGGVIVSQAVANEVAGKTAATFSDLGLLELRNIARPVHAFHILPGPGGWLAHTGAAMPQPAPWPRWRRCGVAVAACAAVMVAAVATQPWQRQLASSSAAVAAKLVAHREAVTLVGEGLAIRCDELPCPRDTLAARTLYEQAIAKDPDYGTAYAYAALTYTRFIANNLSLDESADLHTAEQLAVKAAALAPNEAIAHRARAAVLSMQPDRLQDALAAYMRSLAIDPGQVAVRGNVGFMLLKLGRPAEAENFLSQALSTAPNDTLAPSWLTNWGLAELFLHHDGHGAPQFRRALALQAAAATNGDIGLQRQIDLAAALALDGAVDEARTISAGLLQRYPALSTQSAWYCDCSQEAGYQSGIAELKRGMKLAGFQDIP